MDSQNPYQPPNTDISPRYDRGTDQTSPFSPFGRFGRLSFIAWGVILGVVSNLINAVLGGTQLYVSEQKAEGMPIPPDIGAGVMAVLVILSLGFLPLYVIFAIRRCHDFNASGWWNLLMLFPLVNLCFLVFLLAKPGDLGANNYGPNRITPSWEMVVGIIGIVLAAVGLVSVIGGTVGAFLAASSAGG
jgi:uncharacterized membrane protein YhaH (DUF805 family)